MTSEWFAWGVFLLIAMWGVVVSMRGLREFNVCDIVALKFVIMRGPSSHLNRLVLQTPVALVTASDASVTARDA